MKYCSNCGAEVNIGQDVCLNCGFAIAKNHNNKASDKDTGSVLWGILGFFFPIVGLILYLVWKDDQPLNAKSAGKGALISVIVGAVLAVIWVVLVIVMFASINPVIYP